MLQALAQDTSVLIDEGLRVVASDAPRSFREAVFRIQRLPRCLNVLRDDQGLMERKREQVCQWLHHMQKVATRCMTRSIAEQTTHGAQEGGDAKVGHLWPIAALDEVHLPDFSPFVRACALGTSFGTHTVTLAFNVPSKRSQRVHPNEDVSQRCLIGGLRCTKPSL